MAKNKGQAVIKVFIDGKEQANRTLEDMTRNAEILRKKIEELRNEQASYAGVNQEKYDALSLRIQQTGKALKELNKSIRDTESGIYATEKALENLANLSERSLKKEQSVFKQRLSRAIPGVDKEQLEKDAKALIAITDEIERRKNSIAGYAEMFENIENAADKSLVSAKDRLKELMAAAKKDSEELIKIKEKLAKIEEEQQRRISSKAGSVMSNLRGSSINEIKEAVKVTEQLRDAQKLGSQEWEIYNDEISRAQKYLSDFNELGKRTAMSNRMNNLAKAGVSALAELKKFWQEQIDGAEKGSVYLFRYEKHLKSVIQEEQRRISSKAGNVMGNLDGSSVDEIKEAIKVTEQLRDTQKLGSQEWEIYNDEISRAQKYLSDFNELGKRTAMTDRMNDLAKASTSALAELKKFWQEQIDGAERGSAELAEYEKYLKSVNQEQQRRITSKAGRVMGNLDGSSVDEIKEAIKVTEQLRDAQKYGTSSWMKYNKEIQLAQKRLSDFNELGKRAAMSDRMKNLTRVSASALTELKKFWQEQIDGAERGSIYLSRYERHLNAVINEEQRRTSSKATGVIDDVNRGAFEGTISETKEAIKLLEEYKKSLKLSDTNGLKEVNEAIGNLNERLKLSAEGAVSLQDALKQATEVGEGSFDGTYEDLEKLKKSLEEYKKQLNISDVDGLEEINKALESISQREQEASEGMEDIEEVISNIKSLPLEKLEKVAAQLQRELSSSVRNTEDYVRTSARLRQVNAEIDRVRRSWKEHNNQIEATIKRLASYVMVYAGFNEIWGRTKQLFTENVELSDSLADIQKTTGMSAESVAELSREIDNIDTRTAQKELHDLAYEAGKLGISAKEDVLGFVKAGNQLLVALGEDLGGAEAVRQLMKVNAILGETQRLGIEKSLLATGSAINEITQTSRASAGPITDIVTRIGAIGNAANMSMADLIALAGSADALGQQVEMSGTALNKFISALTSDTTTVAQAVGLDDAHLKSLINQGNTIEAVIAVFEKMNAMRGLDVLSPIVKDLGSDGELIKQLLVTLSSGVDELKAQVFTSSRAFEQATSVTNEYNIKNENAAAIIARMGNSIKENFVNSGLVGWITDVVRWMDSIPSKLKRGEAWTHTWVAALKVLMLYLILSSKALRSFGAGIKDYVEGIGKAIKAGNGFKDTLIRVRKAMLAHPWTALAIAIGVVVEQIGNYMQAQKEAMRIRAEYQTSIDKEVFELNNLRDAIARANTENGERAALIKQLNDKYGAYLGFMVDENTYAREQATIYDLINARLKENLSLKMGDKMMENITDKYTDEIQDLNGKIIQALNGMEGIGETNAGEAMSLISGGIAKAAEEGGDLYDALDRFMKKFGKSKIQIVFSSDAKKLLEVHKKIREEAKATKSYLDGVARASNEEADKILRTSLQSQNRSILGSTNVKELDIYIQKATTFVQRMQQELAELAKKKEENGQLDAADEKAMQNKNKLIEVYQKNIENAEKRIHALGMKSVWGESMDLEVAGVDKLVATYKKLEGAMKSINEDKDYADTFAARGFKSAKEEYEALKRLEEDVKKVLAEKWGRDEHGNWLNPKKGREKKKAIKEEIDAAMAALETYFVNRQTLIKEQAAKEEITLEEMGRRLEKNEFEHLNARVKLRRVFLGEQEALTEEERKQYGLQEKNLGKLADFLMKKGSAMRDGIRLGIAEDQLKMREDLLKHREAIRKIIQDNDYVGLTEYEFSEAIDRLELLFGQAEDRAVTAGKARLMRMKELSKEAYLINKEELKARMNAMEEFSGWEKGKTEEDYAALLVMLCKYHDDYESAENRAVERRRRIADKKWKKNGEKDKWDETDKEAQQEIELIQGLQGLGIAPEEMVEDAKLEMYRLRVEASKAYMEQMQREMELEVQQTLARKMNADAALSENPDDENAYQNLMEAEMAYEEAKRQQALMTLDARQKVNEAMTELDKQEMGIQKRKLETLKGYTDAIVNFGEQMGEAAFGEVEDRKAAAKQLLQTTMKLTKDLIMQKVQKLVMEKMLGKQEIANEAATQGTITALHGSQAITDMTVTAAKTEGDIAAGTAAGSAKTIGELGWWGIPLIAVIGAALSALMGMAMGKLNKAKEEVAAATGVSSNKGRVAAGMLTYAQGDYPVLGNDGKIYNASYEKELKTGVYGGGAHFGIFSEKKPEMIVDGDTTQKIMLDYPHIYESILTIARHGQLKSAVMPVYAAGNYPANAAPLAAPGMVAIQEPMNAEMAGMLSEVASALYALTDRLNKPINATMDPYAANKQIQKADQFMRKNRLL